MSDSINPNANPEDTAERLETALRCAEMGVYRWLPPGGVMVDKISVRRAIDLLRELGKRCSRLFDEKTKLEGQVSQQASKIKALKSKLSFGHDHSESRPGTELPEDVPTLLEALKAYVRREALLVFPGTGIALTPEEVLKAAANKFKRLDQLCTQFLFERDQASAKLAQVERERDEALSGLTRLKKQAKEENGLSWRDRALETQRENNKLRMDIHCKEEAYQACQETNRWLENEVVRLVQKYNQRRSQLDNQASTIRKLQLELDALRKRLPQPGVAISYCPKCHNISE